MTKGRDDEAREQCRWKFNCAMDLYDIPVDTTQNPYERPNMLHNCSNRAFTGYNILSLIGLFMLTPAHKTQ